MDHHQEAVIRGEGATGEDDDLEAEARSAVDMPRDRDTSYWDIEIWQNFERKCQLS